MKQKKILAWAVTLAVSVAACMATSPWLARRALADIIPPGEPPHTHTKWIGHAFTQAACNDDKNKLEELFRGDYQVGSQDFQGRTALHCAAMRGDLDLARKLLARGAKPNVTSNQGLTPVHEAAGFHHLDMLKLLIKHGGDINRASPYGTPIMVAMNHRNGSRRKPPKWRSKIPIRRDIATPIPDIFDAMRKLGAGLDGTDKDGNTLLHVAATTLDARAIEVLLANGKSLNTPNRVGETPFMLAVSNMDPASHSSLIRHLLQTQPDIQINARSVSGRTILFSVFKDPADLVKLYVAHGLDINVALEDGNSVWPPLARTSEVIAFAENFPEIGTPLRPDGTPGRGPLHVYAQMADVKLVSYFLKRGGRADAVDHEGNTPLHKVVSNTGGTGDWKAARKEIVLRLLAAGADINARDHYGRTPLMRAAGQPPEIVRLLVEKGADVNAVATRGGRQMHVLDWFLGAKNTEGIALLIQMGSKKK